MAEFISRESALDVLNKLARDNFTLKEAFSFYLGALHDAADGIKNIPPIDAVSVETLKQFKWERDVALKQLEEIDKGLGSTMDDVATVVRCEDCEHYKHSAVADRNMCFRKDVDGVSVCYDFQPDDFCRYGERRTDENDN